MSLRDRLRARPLPSETVRFPDDMAEWTAAHQQLQNAAAAVEDALKGGDPPPELLAAEEAAQARVEALETIEWLVRALSPSDYEALLAQHPAADDEHAYDAATFYPALLAETTSSGGESMTAQEWAEVTASGGGLTLAELNYLVDTALRLNTTASVVQDAVGKGSSPTRS